MLLSLLLLVVGEVIGWMENWSFKTDSRLVASDFVMFGATNSSIDADVPPFKPSPVLAHTNALVSHP